MVRSRNSVTVSARVTEQEGGMLCPQRCQCGVQGVLWRGGGKGNVPEVHGAEKDGVTEPEQLSSKMQQAPFPFVI